MTNNTSETNVAAPLQQDKVEVVDPKNVAHEAVSDKANAPAETHEDTNWRAFREARKKDRAEREAAEKRAQEKEAEAAALKAAMEAAFAKTALQTHNQQNFGFQEEETEDQRIEKKVKKIIAEKEAQIQREYEEREIQEYPRRLQQTYADFNQAISQENLDYLDYHYPEVSRPLQRLRDGYDKWSDIYLAIKKFVPNHAAAKKEAAKAESNFNKPKSISSTGLTQVPTSPTSHIIPEDKKAANWERMRKIMNQVS